MAIQKDGAAPYAPYGAILEIINHARDGRMQRAYTNDVLIKIGVTESLAGRVLQSLKLVELVNDDGTPAEQFEGLRRVPGEEFQATLANHIREVYVEVFNLVDPSTATFERVRDQFRGNTPQSQQARMAKLFLGLCAAAGIVEEVARSQRSSNETSSSRRASTTGTSTSQKSSGRSKKSGGLGWDLYPSAVTGMIKALPKDGEGWTEDQRDSFIETFPVVLKFSYPIVEPPKEEPIEEDD